jgi:hypothetical protein
VGGETEPALSAFRGAFRGAPEIAFASKGGIFISDGYANARILEYTEHTADGRKGPRGRVSTPWRMPATVRRTLATESYGSRSARCAGSNRPTNAQWTQVVSPG